MEKEEFVLLEESKAGFNESLNLWAGGFWEVPFGKFAVLLNPFRRIGDVEYSGEFVDSSALCWSQSVLELGCLCSGGNRCKSDFFFSLVNQLLSDAL